MLKRAGILIFLTPLSILLLIISIHFFIMKLIVLILLFGAGLYWIEKNDYTDMISKRTETLLDERTDKGFTIVKKQFGYTGGLICDSYGNIKEFFQEQKKDNVKKLDEAIEP